MSPDVLLEVIDRRVDRRSDRLTAFAEVTATGPLTVTFPGDSAAVSMSRLSTYTPTVGDTAVLLKVGTRFVAIGSLA